ncbi:MAG: diguanylate cyclase [Lachnospiraceae bacterium]|nr:diguanylate cyclase [Lachnospiraceae bacterium]
METMLSHEQIASIVDNIICGICVFAIDDSGTLTPIYLNEGIYRMLGYKYSELDRMVKDIRRVIIPEDMPRFDQAVTDVLKDDGAVEVEFRTVTGDGNVRWLQVRANLYGRLDGYKLISAVIFDATERKNIEEEFNLQMERNNILNESAKEHILDYNVRTDVLNIKFENNSFVHGEVVVKDFITEHDFAAVHRDDRENIREIFLQATKSKIADLVEFRSDYFEEDNQFHWYRMNITSVMGMDGYITRIVGRVSNIDDKKKKEIELKHKAEMDSLTGLLNKGAATVQITAQIAKCYSENKKAALLMLDLDHFKSVNDTFGHAVGDEVIAESGKIIRDAFRGSDIVGRMGGDEFMVLMDDIRSEEDALKMARKLNFLLTRKLTDSRGEVKITSSIGIAVLPEEPIDYETLYRQADLALYRTKETGRDGTTVYGEPDMKTVR